MSLDVREWLTPKLLPDFIPPTSFNCTLNDDLASVMQEDFFLPAIPTKRQRAHHCARTHLHKGNQTADVEEPPQSIEVPLAATYSTTSADHFAPFAF
jgi:hypothetical protein